MTVYTVPADARPAASLILVRDGAGGVEVLMLRRAEREGDLRSGVCVFPGGVVDARDADARAHSAGGDDADLSGRFGLASGMLDYAIAALRETFEEVGLLLAVDEVADARAAAAWRPLLARGEVGIADVCAALGLTLDLSGVHAWSHWLTPPGAPKRFDTRFFAARAPAGQEAEADLGEALELMWLTPTAALSKERGLKLLPVTRDTLRELQSFASADAVLAAAAARRDIALVMPRIAADRNGARAIVVPGEWAYDEVAKLDPDGRGGVLADIVPGRAVRLSARVVRVTAPNPGVMTGPGTNSYLVRDDATGGWTAVDPGPADAAHLRALQAAAPGPITTILVTHTHVDHSPGAVALAAATGAPVLGRRPAFAAGQDATFAPAREPAHGERIAGLRAIHTPGHASNHLCWLLEDERLLFTGDHVMQGSTVVINPPDGDMAAYLGALEALLDEDVDWLAPGHGFLVARPKDVLRALIAHRLKREAKVLAALGAEAEPIDALVARVYDDVPAALHPVARRSLLAHLLKLQVEGRAAADGERWRGAAPPDGRSGMRPAQTRAR